jgi:3-oxoadipate enol-lactonase
MSSVEVRAVVSGRAGGPVVLLSNSLGSTHRMWDAQLDIITPALIAHLEQP